MIISFTVRNFKSIKDEQCINFYAENLNDVHSDNIAFPDKQHRIGVLKTAGIYGANASGKSNILKAFNAFQYIVESSSDWKLNDKINCYDPFRLDAETRKAPCFFKLDFIGKDGLRYAYQIEFSQDRIEKEQLDFYPTAREVSLFKRKTDFNGKFKFTPGNQLKGKRRIIPCMKNNLYLSKAANTEDAPEIIKSLYQEIRENINFLTPKMGIFSDHHLQNDDYLNRLALLLKCADTGISEVGKKKRDKKSFPFNLEKVPEAIRSEMVSKFEYEPIFIHNGFKDNFEIEDESDGTRRLYDLAPLILLALPRGEVVIVDELDNTLHPYVSEFIIKLFNDPETNPNNAQLIFAVHDITLLNQDYMRRDQFWFTRKDKMGATELYSLDEFKETRANSPFAKWYTQERFGAVPEIDFKKFKNNFLRGNKENA